MMQEINPAETTRAYAFEMWMNAPMPMVTIIRTLDVTHLRRSAKRHKLKFNMLMCWCIGAAASRIKEFYMLPVNGKLMQYDSIAVNTIVENSKGEINSCDIPFTHDLNRFNDDYLNLTAKTAASCTNHDITDRMVIGTSALARYKIDGAVGMYSGIFNNPFLIWGRYSSVWFRTKLVVSFQFHHTQMDGAHAARFLEALQYEITTVSISTPQQ